MPDPRLSSNSLVNSPLLKQTSTADFNSGDYDADDSRATS